MIDTHAQYPIFDPRFWVGAKSKNTPIIQLSRQQVVSGRYVGSAASYLVRDNPGKPHQRGWLKFKQPPRGPRKGKR